MVSQRIVELNESIGKNLNIDHADEGRIKDEVLRSLLDEFQVDLLKR
jgi:ferredoxin-fold anticodon binding domain-containing protein